MLKALYPVLALLALLLAAIGGAWNVAPSGARASEHSEHVASYDLTSIDNDNDDDDSDDVIVSSVLAPPSADEDADRDDTDSDIDAEGDGDASALPPIAVAARFPSLGAAGSLSMTRWGLRPSGEHRASADRPPRV